MSEATPDLKATIRQKLISERSRKVWVPTDFVDFGSRDAVDKTLQRLVKSGELRRIDRGLYDLPRFNSLTKKINPPDPLAVIEAVSRRDQARMLVDGMTAANDLGLTDAVPAKVVVHTDARRRPIRLGNVTISFRLTAASKLYWAGRPAMRVVQALHWLRDMLPREGEQEQLRLRLTKLLADQEHGASLRSDLKEGLSAMPIWMQVYLKPLLNVQTGKRNKSKHQDLQRNQSDGDRGRKSGGSTTLKRKQKSRRAGARAHKTKATAR